MSLTPTVPHHSAPATALLALMAELEAAPATELNRRATAVLHELTDAELVVVLAAGEVVAASGGNVSPPLGHDLHDAAEQGRARVTLPGGEATLAAARLHGPAGWLLLARSPVTPAADLPELVTGAAKLLDLHHRLALAAEAEAAQHRRGEREMGDR